MNPEPRANPNDDPPAVLGPYELCARIAEGGMATVWLARDTRNPGSDLVALKLIRNEFARHREFLDMFHDEASITRHLDHDGVVRQLDMGRDAEHVYLALELVTGQTLWDFWHAIQAESRRIHPELVAWIGAELCEGLDHAHGLKDDTGRPFDLVHRDVNASNVMITYDGAVKLIDFGLAKARNRLSKTTSGFVKGKVAYLSPEQADGQPADARSDLFSLGVTLWELSVNRRLFKRDSDLETLQAVHEASVTAPADLVADFPADLSAAIVQALARDPAARFASARELGAALRHTAARRRDPSRDLARAMTVVFAEERAMHASWLARAMSTPKGHLAELEPLSTSTRHARARAPAEWPTELFVHHEGGAMAAVEVDRDEDLGPISTRLDHVPSDPTDLAPGTEFDRVARRRPWVMAILFGVVLAVAVLGHLFSSR